MAKDIFGRTVFKMALENCHTEIMDLILSYCPGQFNIAEAVFKYSRSKKIEEMNFHKMVLAHVKPEDRMRLCVEAIVCYDFSYIKKFILDHKECINQPSPEGHVLLLVAIEHHNTYIVELLLKNGASALVTGKLMFGTHPKPISSLAYVILNNKKEYFKEVLGVDASLLLPILLANMNTQHKLPDDMHFDLSNPIHKETLSALLLSAIHSKNQDRCIELAKHCDAGMLDQIKIPDEFMDLVSSGCANFSEISYFDMGR